MVTQSVLLLGSTDFTLVVADAVERAGAKVGAIAHAGQRFSISYAREGVANVRRADIPSWCATHNARSLPYTDVASLTRDLHGTHYAACILAGWYHMVPATLRRSFGSGCLGLHASLLPQLRGGAPLNWAILSELVETGVTLFAVGDGVDDGPIYDQERFAIAPRARIADLVEASGRAAEAMIVRSLPSILAGSAQPWTQIGAPSYGAQRTPEDGRINWRAPAVAIDRLVRAVSRPYPGALTTLHGRQIAIHATSFTPGAWAKPGQIGPDATVTCGAGSLTIHDACFDDGENAIPSIRNASGHTFG